MADELTPRPESVWKRITRLFRSGPIVRHKIAAGEKLHEPRGTAKAYKKELSSLYVHSLASYGQYERLSRYADYSEMEFTPEIASALDIYADETTSYNEQGQILAISSDDEELKSILETLFFDILNIEYNIWSWTRNLCKYGDFILFVDAAENNGILNLLPIPINEIEREEGYDKEDPFAVRFRWLTQGNMVLENWQIVHVRLLGNDNFLPYGSSIIEPARRIWRQLILIEDAMLVYRLVRSPERRVFKIDVGNIPPDQVDSFMEQVKTTLRRTQVIDPSTGRVDLRYNPLSVDEDYFLPVRGDRSSTIETLAGGQFTGDIDDVQYIQNKLFAALKIPKAYLGYEGELGSKATLAQQDVRFARTIERIQRIIVAELNKIAIIHLFLLGYSGTDLVNFELKLAGSSVIFEQQKLELWRTRFEVAATAQEGILDRDTIYERLFNFSEKEIEKVKEGKKADKLEDLTLDAMQAPAAEGEGEAGGEGGGAAPVPGEEELPNTLGGPEGGGENPPAGGGEATGDEAQLPAPEGVDHGQVIEKKNKGSEGNQAEISVSKGKDLFSTGEDQSKLAFGTEKQTASDPYDLRSISRLIKRPFGEGRRNRAPVVSKKIFLHENMEPDAAFRGPIERTQKIEREAQDILNQLSEIVSRGQK
ncbi:MAG: portal protein [Acidiferrobacterales bacterium]